MLKGKYSQLMLALVLLGMLYTLMREPLGRVVWNVSFWIVLLTRSAVHLMFFAL